MTKFIIEFAFPENYPGSRLDQRNIIDHWCAVAQALGSGFMWVESHITNESIIGVFLAEHENLIHQHALQVGLPVRQISKVSATITPKRAALSAPERLSEPRP